MTYTDLHFMTEHKHDTTYYGLAPTLLIADTNRLDRAPAFIQTDWYLKYTRYTDIQTV